MTARLGGEDFQGATIDSSAMEKQKQVISNPNLKTTMTTSIRNIMRQQDKGLLTTSSRLLNAGVRRQEIK